MAKEFDWETQNGKGIFGSMDDDGVVTFAIEAGEGSIVRGSEMFSRMMEHFGVEVQAIHGIWRVNAFGRPSTNIDKVNQLTAEGMSLEEAVLHAWTVTRARKLGFTIVRVLGVPQGSPGAYTEIDVWIEKQSSRAG